MKNFEMPNMTVTFFDNEDVITTSGDEIIVNSDGSINPPPERF